MFFLFLFFCWCSLASYFTSSATPGPEDRRSDPSTVGGLSSCVLFKGKSEQNWTFHSPYVTAAAARKRNWREGFKTSPEQRRGVKDALGRYKDR